MRRVAGIAGGLAWAAIVAALRAHLHASEILVSLMLTYVAGLIVKYLVFGPWQDPASNNFPFTVSFEDNALFTPLLHYFGFLEGTRINTSLLLTLVAIALTWVFMKRSFTGFQLRVAGDAPAARSTRSMSTSITTSASFSVCTTRTSGKRSSCRSSSSPMAERGANPSLMLLKLR